MIRDLKRDLFRFERLQAPEKIKLHGFGNSPLKEFLVGNQRRTSPDTIIGTAQYLAPEQALGSKVDGRADIYSLGVILYEMLAHACHSGQPMPVVL